MKTCHLSDFGKALVLAATLFAAAEAGAFNPQPDPPGHLGMVGIISGQTLRLNVVNIGDPNQGNLGGPDTRVELTFIDSRGALLAPTVERMLPAGEASFVDFSLPAGGAVSRLQVRALVQVISDPGFKSVVDPNSGKRRGVVSSLEVFDSETGKTTIFIGDPGL